MTVKAKPEMKQYRAVITVLFDAPDRETAVARAKELYDTPNSKVRVQEASVAWLTLPETSAPSS
jgi:hypothetical protein